MPPRKTKKKETTQRGAPRFGRQRAFVAIGLFVIGLLSWGMHAVWQHVAPSVIHRDRYLLAAERITMSTLPEWISADVRAEVIRDSGLDHRLSVLDDQFVQIVSDAFLLHPWIESVDKITKSYPPGVDVEVTFRRPVAVVEMVTNQGVQLVPIDNRAIHLPAADVPEIRKRYLPRVGGIAKLPPVGQPWTDPRVVGAAELAQRLADSWESLHLVDILPSARPEIQGEHRFFIYNLITRGGTKIVWGAAPTTAPPGEHQFALKLQRLRACVDRHGPLDSVRGPAVVDVRRELAITPRTVKKPPSPNKVLPVVK